jgi:hypothetical protein
MKNPLLDRKKGVSSLPFQGESSKNFAEFQAPSDDCGANPKSLHPKSLHPKSLHPKLGDGSPALLALRVMIPVIGDGSWIHFPFSLLLQEI